MAYFNIVFGIIGALFFFLVGYMLRKYTAKMKIKRAEERSKIILEQAQTEAEARRRESQLEAKDLLLKLRSEFENETKERKKELVAVERRLSQREENVDRKVDFLDRKEKEFNDKIRTIEVRERDINDKNKELDRLIFEEKDKLQKISGMSRDEARRILLKRLEEELNKESAELIHQVQTETKEKADKEARKIIGLAIQKCATDHTVETTVSVVNLPSDEMKGRIIGREGRNIRALEIATGIDVIIDDTPEAVILSGFDMMRREIARISLERL
ncbi:MAG: Rnase Y domain-containing protein, partial [Candidatus Omnitrophica bacterium]|nr:Rnase Y domain-containing protein [Candidatus Omnitrophota bacterium]